MTLFHPARFNRAMADLGCQAPPHTFDKLSVAYREPGRHYHTDRHVSACLKQLDEHRALARNPAAVEVALWFHDAIYDTHRGDNEERSAEWCQTVLLAGGCPAPLVGEVSEMILATKNHAPRTQDAMLLCDIDLAILGAAPAVFSSYNLAIRKEYHWVEEGTYRIGRRGVLNDFLKRPKIYQTPALHALWEGSARENLTRALARLR